MKIVFCLLSTLLVFTFSVWSEVKLPSIYGDDMVLQQQSIVKVTGTANSLSNIRIVTSWDEKVYHTMSDNYGGWSVKIETPSAGGPYDISFNDGEKLILKNILIGEVWLCSGQSNMEMPLRGNSSPVLNASEIILHADNPFIRLFDVERATFLTPQSDCKGEWKESTSETARDFSAMAYQFGSILQKKLNVPIGLILSSVGGTMIETWMSSNGLKEFSEVEISKTLNGLQSPHKEPTSLFNGMIAPLLNIPIKGVIWCQGESDRHQSKLYEKLFPAMVADWRKHWKLGEFPFYYVQIAPYGSTNEKKQGALLREVQLNAMKIIPNSGMVSAIDVGMEKDIHYMDKTTPAQRLAYWALGETYHIKGINYQGPIYKSMEIEDDKVILNFEHAPYLTSYKKPLTLFEIAGDDKVFFPANADINRQGQVIVKSEKVLHPVAVRYAFQDWVVGELYNNDGLPASSFRTDDW